jgi:hypothetical protein
MSWPTSARHLIPAPLRISLLYALFGISWIVVSDLLVWREGGVSAHGLLVGPGKGLVFVLASALLLYTLVRILYTPVTSHPPWIPPRWDRAWTSWRSRTAPTS